MIRDPFTLARTTLWPRLTLSLFLFFVRASLIQVSDPKPLVIYSSFWPVSIFASVEHARCAPDDDSHG